jgi:PAS domain S-box-containing protein
MPANPPPPHRAVASAPISRVALAGGWLVGVTTRLSAGTGTRIGNGAWTWLHAVCASACVAWLCLFGGLAAAQGTEVAVAECSVPNGGLPLAGTLATWLDPTGHATSFDAREKLAKNAFTANKSDDVSYGFVSGAIWSRVELPPVDSNCYTLLVLEQPRILRVDVFDPTTNGPRSVLAMGAALPFHERALPHRFPNVRLFRTPSEPLELLLRVESNASVQLPFVLHTEASLYANAYTEQAGMGIFYGVVLALLLYNLSMLVGVRDRTYLAAVAYLAALGLFTLGFMGHGAQWLWTDSPLWQTNGLAVLVAGLLASALVFVSSFLDLRQHMPRLDKVMWALAGMQVALGLAGLAGWTQPALQILAATSLLAGAMVTVAGVACVRKGSRPARVFLLSWALLILFGVTIPLSSFGLLPRTLFGEYGMQVGSAAQMLVLSFALVYRVNLMRTEQVVLEREAEREASRKHLETSLQANLDERNTILDNSLVAIAFLNLKGRLVWGNVALYELFRFPQGTGTGESLEPFYLSREAYLEMGAIVTEAIARGDSFECERQMRRRDGSLFWASISGRAVNRNDVSRGTVWSVADITHRRMAEEDIRASLARQQELNQLKTSFVSMASHEFRTPLATILSSAELLQAYHDRLDPEERAATLTSVENAVKRMTRMLDDVLVIGKGDVITNGCNPQPVALARWCERLIRDVTDATPIGQGQRPRIRLDAPPDECLLDETLLHHMVGNLLSNAIKYSPAGGEVLLLVTLTPDAVRFEVSDNGIGIEPADMKRLFETFYRASNVGQISGTGLGLAIVKRAVDQHGGAITARSEAGQGTCFTIVIPLTGPATPTAGPDTHANAA